MKLKSVKNIKLKNKKVFLRVDFNVSLRDDGGINDDFRIRASLPTIRYLLNKGANIIIGTHLGRPNGKIIDNLRTEKLAQRLEDYLKVKVLYVSDFSELKKKDFSQSKILMLENLRFYKGEEDNEDEFSKKLASLADIYVNDAFSVSHRKHSSLSGITKYIPSYAGFLLEKEVKILGNLYTKAKKPLIMAMGGAKVKTKLKILKRFYKKSDKIIVGGVIANVLFKKRGLNIGLSKVDEVDIDNIDVFSDKIVLPKDVVVAGDISESVFSEVKNIKNVNKDDIILDIGPLSVSVFSDIIKRAKTIVWNGPFGYTELEKFSKGTENFAKFISKSNAFTVVGGGDSVSLLDKNKLTDKIDFVSTGGGAMLDFLAGENMPGIEPLIKKSIFNFFSKK